MAEHNHSNEKKDQVNDVVTIDLQPFLTPIAIIIGSILISVSLLVGFSSIGGKVTTGTNTGTNTGTDTGTGTTGEFAAAKTNIDDDAMKGDKNTAKVAIVEFTDYECPFCKRHVTETYGELIKQYVDTGKAIYVVRDFPLYFHDPNATEQALAAECVQELGGDKKYFEFHDAIFAATTSNKGLAKSKLYDLAAGVGVDKAKFTSCLDTEKYKEEVQKDIADGQAAGVSGTPGFVIGKLGSDGSVDGVRVDGAYPLADFQKVIDGYLE